MMQTPTPDDDILIFGRTAWSDAEHWPCHDAASCPYGHGNLPRSHDDPTKFGIRPSDRRRHLMALGATGQGKSALLYNMLVSDIEAGRGVALIDPHGDLAESLLSAIPPSRTRSVVYFDPSDLAHPVGLNVLESVDPDWHFFVADALISVFRNIWQESWGPRMEHIFHATVLSLLQVEGSTLLGVPRLLTDKHYRAWVTSRLADPVLSRSVGMAVQEHRGRVSARGRATTDVDARATGVSTGMATTSIDSISSMEGTGDGVGTVEAEGVSSYGVQHSGVGAGWDGPLPVGLPSSVSASAGEMAGSGVSAVRSESSVENRFSGSGVTSGTAASESRVASDSESHATAFTDSEVEGEVTGQGVGVSRAHARSAAVTRGRTVTSTTGMTESEHDDESWSEGTTTGPMLIPHSRRVPISQMFYSEDEQILMYAQTLATLPDQTCAMKLERASAACLAGDPWVEPDLTDDQRREALAPMRARPWYPPGRKDPAPEAGGRDVGSRKATGGSPGTLIDMVAGSTENTQKDTPPPRPPNIWVRVDDRPDA